MGSQQSPLPPAPLRGITGTDSPYERGHLRGSVRIARADPPFVRQVDLRDGVAALAAEAPKDATLVVFHTAVLGYLPNRADREAFAASVSTACDYWISNEAPRVMPGIAGRAPAQDRPGRFILAVNGVPIAWAAPHGTALEWIGVLPEPNAIKRS